MFMLILADALHPSPPHHHQTPTLCRLCEKRLAHLSPPSQIARARNYIRDFNRLMVRPFALASLASISQEMRRTDATVGQYPRTRCRRTRNR